MTVSEAPRGVAGSSTGLAIMRRKSTKHEQQQNSTAKLVKKICITIRAKHILNKYGADDGHVSSPMAWKVHTIPTINHEQQSRFNILFNK